MLDELQRIEFYKKINPNELTKQQFQKLERELKTKESNIISDEYVDFKLWQMGLPSRQVSFAKYLANRLPRDFKMKILEVGCGRTGRVSRILGEQGFNITGIDPKVEMLSCANVNFIKEKFDYTKFNLSEYNFVIAQEPCEATEHVVRACVNKKIPFIMSLCGVPHKLINGSNPKDEKEWYDDLVNISKKDLKLYYINLDPLTITPILKSIF